MDRKIEFDKPRTVQFRDKNNTGGTIFEANEIRYRAFPMTFHLISGSTYLWLRRPVKVTFGIKDS